MSPRCRVRIQPLKSLVESAETPWAMSLWEMDLEANPGKNRELSWDWEANPGKNRELRWDWEANPGKNRELTIRSSKNWHFK